MNPAAPEAEARLHATALSESIAVPSYAATTGLMLLPTKLAGVALAEIVVVDEATNLYQTVLVTPAPTQVGCGSFVSRVTRVVSTPVSTYGSELASLAKAKKSLVGTWSWAWNVKMPDSHPQQ